MAKESIPEHLAQEWHPTKNGVLVPSQFSSGSSKKVWWLGSCHHEWEMKIHRRALHASGCPYCSNKKVLVGFNDLATTHPNLAAEWHPTKNGNLLPSDLLAGSNVRVWWLGHCKHEWETRVFWRGTMKHKCPYCSNQQVLVGFNDLATTHPNLAAEWHPTKNGNLTPHHITAGGKKRHWWKGGCGHEWQACISDRAKRETKCKKCGPTGVFVSVEAKYPELVSKFHPVKNGNIKLSDISFGSTKLLWWSDDCGHEWEAAAMGNKVLCPYCRNRKIIPGFNDLATTHPDIATEWHPTKNGEKEPTDFSRGNNFRAWWLCNKGHEWSVQINDRAHYDSGCPTCRAATFVSKAEQGIFDYIVSLGLEAEQSNRSLLGKRRELDIYVPEKKLAIEFNGLYWHSESAGKDTSYHYDKWKTCKNKGIQLIQIWEDEWNRNPEQVKQMLAHKLGVSSQEKVFARKTVVAEISNKEAEMFLHLNHIQGYASGSYYLGLKRKENDELVSLIVLKKEAGTNGKTLNIIRYATAANVVGGFTKLLTHAEKLYKPESFITFADHCVSDGGLYENNGFVVDKELAPDYMYIVDGERKHKFGYRLKRFQSDPGLEYVDGLTERELAALNGLERVWDAGKTRYRKSV